MAQPGSGSSGSSGSPDQEDDLAAQTERVHKAKAATAIQAAFRGQMARHAARRQQHTQDGGALPNGPQEPEAEPAPQDAASSSSDAASSEEHLPGTRRQVGFSAAVFGEGSERSYDLDSSTEESDAGAEDDDLDALTVRHACATKIQAYYRGAAVRKSRAAADASTTLPIPAAPRPAYIRGEGAALLWFAKDAKPSRWLMAALRELQPRPLDEAAAATRIQALHRGNAARRSTTLPIPAPPRPSYSRGEGIGALWFAKDSTGTRWLMEAARSPAGPGPKKVEPSAPITAAPPPRVHRTPTGRVYSRGAGAKMLWFAKDVLSTRALLSALRKGSAEAAAVVRPEVEPRGHVVPRMNRDAAARKIQRLERGRVGRRAAQERRWVKKTDERAAEARDVDDFRAAGEDVDAAAQYLRRRTLQAAGRSDAEHAAAVTIQSAARGFLARRAYPARQAARRASEKRLELEDVEAFRSAGAHVAAAADHVHRKTVHAFPAPAAHHAAAVTIQRMARGRLARARRARLHAECIAGRRRVVEEEAALCIQCAWRVYAAHHRLAHRRVDVQNEHLRAFLDCHATVVQASWRRHVAEKDYAALQRRRQNAAALLGRVGLGGLDRRMLRTQHRSGRRNRARWEQAKGSVPMTQADAPPQAVHPAPLSMPFAELLCKSASEEPTPMHSKAPHVAASGVPPQDLSQALASVLGHEQLSAEEKAGLEAAVLTIQRMERGRAARRESARRRAPAQPEILVERLDVTSDGLEAAAITIQRVERGRQARARAISRRARRDAEIAQEYAAEDMVQAALVIQRMVRRLAAKRRARAALPQIEVQGPSEAEAAVRIQRAERRRQAQNKGQLLRARRDAEIAEQCAAEDMAHAALVIQRMVRRLVAKHRRRQGDATPPPTEAERMEGAALVIQRAARGRQARKAAEARRTRRDSAMRQQLEMDDLTFAALVIQRAVRKIARKARRRSRAASDIQRVARGRQARRRSHDMKNLRKVEEANAELAEAEAIHAAEARQGLAVRRGSLVPAISIPGDDVDDLADSLESPLVNLAPSAASGASTPQQPLSLRRSVAGLAVSGQLEAPRGDPRLAHPMRTQSFLDASAAEPPAQPRRRSAPRRSTTEAKVVVHPVWVPSGAGQSAHRGSRNGSAASRMSGSHSPRRPSDAGGAVLRSHSTAEATLVTDPTQSTPKPPGDAPAASVSPWDALDPARRGEPPADADAYVPLFPGLARATAQSTAPPTPEPEKPTLRRRGRVKTVKSQVAPQLAPTEDPHPPRRVSAGRKHSSALVPAKPPGAAATAPVRGRPAKGERAGAPHVPHPPSAKERVGRPEKAGAAMRYGFVLNHAQTTFNPAQPAIIYNSEYLLPGVGEAFADPVVGSEVKTPVTLASPGVATPSPTAAAPAVREPLAPPLPPPKVKRVRPSLLQQAYGPSPQELKAVRPPVRRKLPGPLAPVKPAPRGGAGGEIMHLVSDWRALQTRHKYLTRDAPFGMNGDKADPSVAEHERERADPPTPAWAAGSPYCSSARARRNERPAGGDNDMSQSFLPPIA